MTFFKHFLSPALLLLLSITSIISCSPPSTEEKKTQQKTSNILSNWNDPIKTKLINTIKNAPKEGRVMSFDMDGTLISEVPYYYMVQMMSQHIDVSSLKSKADLITALKKFAEREDYKTICKDYVQNNPPKIYKPMMELIELALEEKYKIIICTGTEVTLAKEIANTYFPMVHEVIGTDLNVRVNDEEGKVENLKEKNIKPMFAFGNSSGDFAMMKYATQKSYLVIKNDEKSKEYDTPKEHITVCKENGFGYYEVNGDWINIF